MSRDSFFEMLIVLFGRPVASPGESMFYKDSFAEVMFVDLMREVLTTVNIGLCRGRLDEVAVDVGVLKGVDIHSSS